MKYAAIRSTTRDTRRKNNIGETIIDLAMEEIYKYMGVPEDDLVYIEKPYLSNYDGETVILPIVKGYPEHQSISKAFPKSIIPVFLCWSLLGGSLNPEDVPYLKAHEPIGCRDEQTLRECEKYGINAYLNGCITICFPKVNYNPNGKVYMVDVPQELIKYIPKELSNDAVYMSHTVPSVEDLNALAKNFLEEYASARLIITQRLHVAIPAIAMGVPVVLAKNCFSSRYSWCDRFVEVYDINNYDSINWKPETIELEEYKEKMFRFVSSRLKYVQELNETCVNIDRFYRARTSREIITPISVTGPYIDEMVARMGKNVKYSLWGVTVLTESVYQYISEKYPEMELIHIYDKYRSLNFHGKMTEKIDRISIDSNEFLIVCPMSTMIKNEMEAHLNELGYSKEKYIIAMDVI